MNLYILLQVHTLKAFLIPLFSWSMSQPHVFCHTPYQRLYHSWSEGKYLAWDATIVHTCAASYVSTQAASIGPASVQAVNRKTTKYGGLPSAHIFQPVAIETLGPINNSACDFISEIGRRISTISGDGRETSFLYQRLSITIQRYNLVAFSGTFSSAVDDEA